MGMMKNVNGYHLVKILLRELDPQWFQYVGFNRRRVCLQARNGFSKRYLLTKAYHLK